MHLICRVFLSRSLVFWVALLSPCSALWSASTFAQAEQILVVSGEKVPDNLHEAVSDALGDVGSVVSPSGYTAKLRARNEAPDSEEALTEIAPQTGASLIVVLQQARNKLKVELRNGHTGDIVGRTSLPGRGKRAKLAKPARKKLIAAAKRAIKKVGPAPSKRASAEDDFSDGPAPQQTPTPAARQPIRPSPPSADEEQTEPAEEEEQASELDVEAEEAPPRDAPASPSGEGMSFRLRAGMGLGTRSIVVPLAPSRAGLGNRIDTSFVPSLDIGAALELPLGPEWLLRFLADYRTIFGLRAGYLTAPGMMASSSLSSHSIIAGASLGYLSDGRDSFGVHVLLGWAYRSLSAAEPSLPSAAIQGVMLRPEIEIPIANRRFALRLAPELILILVPSATLPTNDSALAKGVGLAIGAEVSVDLHITQTIGLSAQFRESRGSTPSGWGSTATENERYFALRLLVQL